MRSVARKRPSSRPEALGDALRFGPYEARMELASGGMATVYLAQTAGSGSHGSSGRFAAVKVIHPHLMGDAQFAEMFVDEAEIASRIRHPNVCGVYDFEVGPELAYMAMEYLVGVSMAKLQRKLAATRERDHVRDARMVCRALADACEGLHAAHELTDDDGVPLDVVHRDVSPGNVMLTFDGVAKVVDFGVAAAARKRHRTQTGMLKGKFAYIAPEYLLGKKADRRADVWGVGVLAWELVTSERLFRRDTDADTLRAVMDEPVPAPSTVRPELPAELDAVLMKALARDPAQRYASARELGRDLARCANVEEGIVHADLAEWLQSLFPGAHARRQYELELAGQRHEEGVASSRPPPPPDVEPTRLYERLEAPPPSPVRDRPHINPPPEVTAPMRAPRTPWLVAGALLLGCTIGGLAVHLSADVVAADPARSTPTTTPLTPPEPAERAIRPAPIPRLQLQAGVGLAHGPYVVEVSEGEDDALLLSIRREPAPEAPETQPPEPRRRARRTTQSDSQAPAAPAYVRLATEPSAASDRARRLAAP
ncbi:MAG: hypothetical protein SangKO_034910 [Sandaracinaceae bacterium]